MKNPEELDAIHIDYVCSQCGVRKSNQDMSSMLCFCGGSFSPDGALFGEAAIFEPYYDRILGSWVSSYGDQERKAVSHRSPSHPEGLRLVQWDRKQINEYKNIHKHKEDYKASQYEGYKPGQKTYNPDRPDAHGHRPVYFCPK